MPGEAERSGLAPKAIGGDAVMGDCRAEELDGDHQPIGKPDGFPDRPVCPRADGAFEPVLSGDDAATAARLTELRTHLPKGGSSLQNLKTLELGASGHPPSILEGEAEADPGAEDRARCDRECALKVPSAGSRGDKHAASCREGGSRIGDIPGHDEFDPSLAGCRKDLDFGRPETEEHRNGGELGRACQAEQAIALELAVWIDRHRAPPGTRAVADRDPALGEGFVSTVLIELAERVFGARCSTYDSGKDAEVVLLDDTRKSVLESRDDRSAR